MLAGFAGALLSVAFAIAIVPAAGEYRTVAGPLQQWVWLRTDAVPMTAAAVRDDGWLVVATGRHFDGRNMVGGGLVLVPPWGGTAIPFGDAPNLTTKAYRYTSLVARGDRLFGLTSAPDESGAVGQMAELVEFDAASGKVVAFHGKWWHADLTVDPQTGDLVLWTFSCTGECDPRRLDVDDDPEEMTGVITHDLVRYDPETRRRTAVLVPDPMRQDVGGSGTCAGRRDSLHRCEEVFRVAFSPDGSLLFLGSARAATNAIDVRDRDGRFRASIAAPRPIDALSVAPPASCLAGALVFTSFDGTTWAVPGAGTPAGASGDAVQLAAGAPGGKSDAAITPDGDVVTLRRSEAVLLSCPATARVAPPVAAPPAPPPATPAEAGAAGSAGAPSQPAPPGGPAAPPSNVPPPVQPPATPAVAGPISHAPQAVTSAQVGLVDAHEEQPVYGLSASSRLAGPGHLTRAVTAVGVAGFAAVAYLTIPDPRRRRVERATPARIEVRR